MRTLRKPAPPKSRIRALQKLAKQKKRSAVVAAAVDEDVAVKARQLPRAFRRKPSRNQQRRNPCRRCNRGHRRRNAINLPERLRSKPNRSNERQRIPRRRPLRLKLSSLR